MKKNWILSIPILSSYLFADSRVSDDPLLKSVNKPTSQIIMSAWLLYYSKYSYTTTNTHTHTHTQGRVDLDLPHPLDEVNSGSVCLPACLLVVVLIIDIRHQPVNKQICTSRSGAIIETISLLALSFFVCSSGWGSFFG